MSCFTFPLSITVFNKLESLWTSPKGPESLAQSHYSKGEEDEDDIGGAERVNPFGCDVINKF